MAWWDLGIRGRDGEYLVKSGGLSYPLTPSLPNIVNPVFVGSVSYDTNPELGVTYKKLLLTTGSGTQIYLEYQAQKLENVDLYLPTEQKNCWQFNMNISLRKNGTDLVFSSGGGGYCSTIIAGEGSIYNWNYRRTNGGIDGAHAYPRSKESGGATNQIAMISQSDGLYFYAVGFPIGVLPNPCTYIGRIPSTALSNPYWFDQDADALTDSEYYQIIGGSTTPDKDIDYQYPGDDIDFPDLPTGASALGFGKLSIFEPSSAQLASALDILWSMVDLSTLTDIFDTLRDVIVKLIYKPEQYCISLMTMPVDSTGTNKRIYFGKYDTGVDAVALSSQYQVVDCGTLSVPLKSGSSFDYSPHVKAMIFIPYVGFRPINVNEIMGGDISIKYYVDMFSGSAICFVKIANSLSNTSVLYTYECNISTQIPINSTDYHSVINSLISASASLATSIVMPNPVTIGATAGKLATTPSLAQSTPDVQTSGKYNGNIGALGNEKPYVVLHFPVQSIPTGFVNQYGYPSNVNTSLSNLSGYTEVEKIHLNITGAYKEDLTEIESLMHEGIIL